MIPVKLVGDKSDTLIPCLFHVADGTVFFNLEIFIIKVDFNNQNKDYKDAIKDPDYKTFLKKDIAKDLGTPAMANVTGPIGWKGPKADEPNWQKALNLNTKDPENPGKIIPRLLNCK